MTDNNERPPMPPADQTAPVEIMPDEIPATMQLESLRDGQVVGELMESISEMARMVIFHQKKGTVTLKLTIAPLPGEQIIVMDEVVTTPPKGALPSAIRFLDKRGQLVKNDPNALDLMSRLRSIDPETGEVG